ncbi:hypothetical protein L2E82_50810 [Cichorium intybus]|nr:hypothetical protein L2E82_50810 [Cichorium intybus]
MIAYSNQVQVSKLRSHSPRVPFGLLSNRRQCNTCSTTTTTSFPCESSCPFRFSHINRRPKFIFSINTSPITVAEQGIFL